MPSRCRPGCSLEIVAELLAGPDAITGEEADYLLDFHQLVKTRRDAEATLRLFCDLRRRLEPRHYLIFYRLRRWLENQIVVQVRSGTGTAPAVVVPLRLNFYCIEAVRRFCLCAALERGASFKTPRLTFAFAPINKELIRPESPPVAAEG
ncbi:MAG TPA: hypothetical protein VEC99_10775 [Clostridia bacterium]|nr:hypothetical protein [Clostridia bacterium]